MAPGSYSKKYPGKRSYGNESKKLSASASYRTSLANIFLVLVALRDWVLLFFRLLQSLRLRLPAPDYRSPRAQLDPVPCHVPYRGNRAIVHVPDASAVQASLILLDQSWPRSSSTWIMYQHERNYRHDLCL